MAKSVLTEGTNFTEGCGNCPFWNDGTKNINGMTGYGCCIPAPIDSCPYFRKMREEEEKKTEGS